MIFLYACVVDHMTSVSCFESDGKFNFFLIIANPLRLNSQSIVQQIAHTKLVCISYCRQSFQIYLYHFYVEYM